MTERKCENCEFWDRNSGTSFDSHGHTRRPCKRNAPFVIGDSNMLYPRWPMTSENDWCGEFKAKEA